MDSFKDFLVDKLDFKDIQLEQVVDIVKLQKKDYLIKPGNISGFIGFVESGVLYSFVLKESDEFNIDFYMPGSFISAFASLMTQHPTNTNFQALSDSTIYSISYTNFNNLL